MTGNLPEDPDDEPGGEVCFGVADSAGSWTPICWALVKMAGAMSLPRVLRAWRATSGCIVQSGTGRALGTAQVRGSRGVVREKR